FMKYCGLSVPWPRELPHLAKKSAVRKGKNLSVSLYLDESSCYCRVSGGITMLLLVAGPKTPFMPAAQPSMTQWQFAGLRNLILRRRYEIQQNHDVGDLFRDFRGHVLWRARLAVV